MYAKGEITQTKVAECTVMIKSAYPALDGGFFRVLFEMLKEDNFSDKKMVDAVKNVIRTCIYPTPTIALFLNYDSRIKFYDREQYLKLNDLKNGKAYEHYSAVKVSWSDAIHYCNNADIKKYNIPPFKKNN